jgi:hypothetical protein
MSIRGRRPHSHVRRLITPPASTRPAVDVEIAETPRADADRLVATFRVRAYSEARQRQRQAAAPEAASHWGQVANLIAQRSRGRQGNEPSGTELDAEVPARARERGVRPAVGFFDVDPLDELERVLASRPQRFRLQFFSLGADLGPTVLSETEIQAADASGAIRDAVTANWPPRAIGLRLLDLEGREIFERLKADLS